MFYAIVTSDNDFFRECYGTLWNFMELYVWGKSSGTLWNFLMCLMERNNYGCNEGSKLSSSSFEFEFELARTFCRWQVPKPSSYL